MGDGSAPRPPARGPVPFGGNSKGGRPVKTVVTVVTVAMMGVVLGAQAPTIDSYIVHFFAPGATAPMAQSESWAVGASVCDQPPQTGSTTNPTRYVWADPVNAGKDCVFTPSAVGTLPSLPIGNFEAVLRAVNLNGASDPSNKATFSKTDPRVPSAPTGFRIVR